MTINSAHKFTGPAVIAMLLTLSACGGRANSPEVQNIHEEIVLSAEEQRLKDSIDSINALPPDILRNKILTREQADSFMRQSGYWTEYSQGVIDTIANQNIEYADRLLHNREPYFIVVDKQKMRVLLYDKYGRSKRAYKMACSAKFGARHAYRDNRTPEGIFTAEGIHNSVEWLYTDDDGNTSDKRGQFGPRFIRLKESPMIGIHGTCAPWSRGRRASHGCIRIHNAHILELADMATPGMPIIISPSERDQRVNRDEGFKVTRLLLPDVEDTPVDEEFPGLREYEEHEKIIQHKRDSIEAVRLARERRKQIADSIEAIEQMQNDNHGYNDAIYN